MAVLTFEQYMTAQYGTAPFPSDSWGEFFDKPINNNLKLAFHDKYSQYKYATQNTTPKFRVINKKKS